MSVLGLLTKSLSNEAEQIVDKANVILGFNDVSENVDKQTSEGHDSSTPKPRCDEEGSEQFMHNDECCLLSGEDSSDDGGGSAFSEGVTVKVLPPDKSLRSALAGRASSTCRRRNIRWSDDVPKDDLQFSLTVRRRALKQLQALCNYVVLSGEGKMPGTTDPIPSGTPTPSLNQDEQSIMDCIRMAELLPAQNICDLRQLLYILPGIPPWDCVTYPLAMDVGDVVRMVGEFEPEFRWIHVQMNFVFSYLAGIQLRPMMLKIIEHQSPMAPIPGFFTPRLCPYKPPPLLLPPVPPPLGAGGGNSYVTVNPHGSFPSLPVVKIHTVECWRDAVKMISESNVEYSALDHVARKALRILDAYLDSTKGRQ